MFFRYIAAVHRRLLSLLPFFFGMIPSLSTVHAQIPAMEEATPFLTFTAPAFKSEDQQIRILVQQMQEKDSEWELVVHISQRALPSINYDDIAINVYNDQGMAMELKRGRSTQSTKNLDMFALSGFPYTAVIPYRLQVKERQVPGKVEFAVKGDKKTFSLIKDANPKKVRGN